MTPVLLTLCCYAVAALIVFMTDRFALPANRRNIGRKRTITDTLARLAIIALVFLLFFCFSWRPIYAAAGTISFFVIFTGISRAKYAFIREPLIFSDIALVLDVFKHKTLFYATRLNLLFWAVALTYVFGASALFMVFEPHVAPIHGRGLAIVLVVLAAAVPWLALFYPPYAKALSHSAERLLGPLDVLINTQRFGTFASVVYHFLVWLGNGRDDRVRKSLSVSQDVFRVDATQRAPLVIIWQSESFIDLRRFGVHLHLPTIDSLRSRAVQWGRLTNIFEGGYTLRTEFAVLTGLSPDQTHADAGYPYLRARHYSAVAWPTKLQQAGWDTHFVHPYEATFFMRHKAMPQLGFAHVRMLDAFAHDETRDGLYVDDATLTDTVLDLARHQTDNQPAFIFAASMENHGPWEAERRPGLTEPVDIYKDILQRSDAALGRLVSKLDAFERPVWLVFYGDHAPLLKAFADPFTDPRTDYLIVPLGTAHHPDPVEPIEEHPWHLLSSLLRHAGFIGPANAG